MSGVRRYRRKSTLDEAESENVIKHALDLGYNFFDTANGYSAGTSEEYLGKALKKNVVRNQVVIASKVYFNEGRLSRQAIMRKIDGHHFLRWRIIIICFTERMRENCYQFVSK